MSAQSQLKVNIYNKVEAAPSYRTAEYKGVLLIQANIVRKGTEEGRSTVDLVFEDETGQKFAMMLTGRLIRNLSAMIGEEG